MLNGFQRININYYEMTNICYINFIVISILEFTLYESESLVPLIEIPPIPDHNMYYSSIYPLIINLHC